MADPHTKRAVADIYTHIGAIRKVLEAHRDALGQTKDILVCLDQRLRRLEGLPTTNQENGEEEAICEKSD